MRTRAALGCVLLLVVASIDCAGRRDTFHDPEMDFSLVRTVAVMPFGNLSSDNNADERVRDVLLTMLQATGAFYVLPPGEAARGISRSSIEDPTAPTPEQVVKLARTVSADAVMTGTVREYGQIRSGTSSANVISVSLVMMEGQTGKVVWSASSTRGGVGATDRLFGGGGKPMNAVTREAVGDLIDKLFH